MGEGNHPSGNLPRRSTTGIASPADTDVVKGDFLARWVEALRRRLRPHATLEVKQFAAAIGVRYETALRWMRGESGPSGEAVAAAVRFFDGRGDFVFRDDLFPAADATRWATVEDRDRQRLIARLVDQLGVERTRRATWFTDTGDMREVPDHSGFARDRLALNDTIKDPSIIALQAGWIAVTESAVRLRIRYADGAPISRAVDRLIHWLLDHANSEKRITRSVLVEGRWIEVDHPTISSIAQSLGDAAAIGAATAPWKTQRRVVSRQAIDDLTPPLGPILAALRQTDGSAEALIQFTFNWPIRDHIGLHRVEGEEVRLAFSGDAMIGKLACALGRDIRERADLAYAMTVREELMGAVTEQQPAHYDRQVPINGVWHHYRNLKYASRPDAAGIYFVLTASHPTPDC
ncbi:MAG TPA: hypothetical protein VLX09_01110 [Stellaceae bacterium]|nr:hypothetical protein [Stellaceae bacterium]